MGISHDIRPKKVHPAGHKVKKEEHASDVFIDHPEHIEIETDSINYSSIDSSKEHSKLEDDFFNYDSKHSHPKRDEISENRAGSSASKWILSLCIFALAGLVVYQNYEMIGQKIGLLGKEEPVEKTEKEETYTGTSSATSETSTTTPAATTTPATTAPATTTPTTSTVAATQTIDKSLISLSVLNGNGITGSADAVADTLKAVGFNPTNITNARKFTYTDTIIYYQTGKLAEAQLVEDVLSARTTSLEESNTIAGKYNVVVVVGKN